MFELNRRRGRPARCAAIAAGRWSWAALAFACVGLGVMSGCGPERESLTAAQDPARPYGPVVFLFDTVRADRSSSYGHVRETTPVIDALAAAGVRFEQAASYSSWTLLSSC
jgi:hypothetical protein